MRALLAIPVVAAMAFGSSSTFAQGQPAIVLTTPADAGPDVAYQRKKEFSRAYFARFQAGEIGDDAPRQIRFRYFRQPVSAMVPIPVSRLSEILRGCRIDEIFQSNSFEEGNKGRQSVDVWWLCPAGSPDRAPHVDFLIMGNRIDDVQVTFDAEAPKGS